MNARRILLVRHGPSAHIHTGWIDAHGFRAWRTAYEAAGISENAPPPPSLAQSTSDASLFLASDAPRAVASARLLASEREVVVSPLLRELDLDAPSCGKLRLPLRAWAFAVGGRMLVQTLRQQYPSPAEAARIDEAADWLDTLAAQHPRLVVVTHAMFRKRLSANLLRKDWQFEPGRRSLAAWSEWTLQRA
jgi:broad specificity phosphatase PhoE